MKVNLLGNFDEWIPCQHVLLSHEYRGTAQWSVSGLDFDGKTLCQSIRIDPESMWCRMEMYMGGGKRRSIVAHCKTFQIDTEEPSDET